MSHLDADSLTLLALGEEAETADRHLAACEICRDELASLRRVVAAGRAIDLSETIPDPPASLWAGIADQLGIDPETTRIATGSRRRRPLALALAAAACIAALAVATVILSNREPDLVAEAQLAALDGSGVEGTASLVRTDGGLALRLDVEGLPDPDGYYEVWLLAEGEDGLISLGPLAGKDAYPLPAGLQPEAFPVVDVSAEDYDGEPSHSGRSLARGTLPV